MGLIPAHAGKTGRRVGLRARLWAHPRSRGENLRPARPSTASPGSSPLTRGKRREGRHGLFASGLIPAHAGKTWNHSTTTDTAAAHPRSRGENAEAFKERARQTGSSPLTRGKLSGVWSSISSTGLIPAHAGKTDSTRGYPRRFGAHPRSRGENDLPGADRALGGGSSPLTRGKHVERLAHVLRLGLIPAHAGKTSGAS